MTYSYDPTKIRAGGKDQMRFELGDTQTEGGAETCALADEEYEAVLAGQKDGKKAWLSAKLSVLEAILFKMSYQVDTRIDVLQYSGVGNRAERWWKMYEDLRKRVSAASSVPTLAPSVAETAPYFHKGMGENPNAMHGAGGPPSPFRDMTT